MIETHVHLCFDASTDPVDNLAARDDRQVVAAMRSAAQTALAGGVTTVRELGDRSYLRLISEDYLDFQRLWLPARRSPHRPGIATYWAGAQAGEWRASEEQYARMPNVASTS